MLKAHQISKIIYQKFPKKHALKWDYIGFSTGSSSQKVNKILIVLDVDNEAIDYAIDHNCNMIISHHPFIFGSKTVVLNNVLKIKQYQKLSKHKIITFSAHTVLDVAPKGLTKWQLDVFKPNKTQALTQDGLGQIGIFIKPVSFNYIIKKAQKKFQNSNLELIGVKPKTLTHLALAGGAHNHKIIDIAKTKKVELLIVGEMKYHDKLYASQIGQNVLIVGHFMEHIFIKKMTAFLQEKTNLKIIAFNQKNFIENIN